VANGAWQMEHRFGEKATYLANFSQKLCQYDVGEN